MPNTATTITLVSTNKIMRFMVSFSFFQMSPLSTGPVAADIRGNGVKIKFHMANAHGICGYFPRDDPTCSGRKTVASA